MTEWVVLELSPKAEGEDPDFIRASIRHMIRDAEIYIPVSVTKVGEDRVISYLVDGYAFIKRAHPDDKYFKLEGSRYVQSVITRVGRAANGRSIRQLACASDDDISRFRGQVHAEENQGIGVGDLVVVTSGPYRQIQATVIEDIPEREEVQVHIKLRSKEDLVTLPRSFLRLVQRAAKSPYLDRVEALRAWFDATRPFLTSDGRRFASLLDTYAGFERLDRLQTRRITLEAFFRLALTDHDIQPIQRAFSMYDLLDRASRSFSFVRAVASPALEVGRLREREATVALVTGWDEQWKSLVPACERLLSLSREAYSPLSFASVHGKFEEWSRHEDIFERLGALANDLDAIEQALTMDTVENVDAVIVDGHNLAIRCASVPGLDTLKDSKGRHTGAIIGTLRSLGSYRKKFPGSDIIVVWDGSSQRRKKLFPEYKAHRVSVSTTENGSNGSSPFDQIRFLRDVLPFLGVRQTWNPEEEADDVIATLVAKYSEKACVVVSTDRDLLQLVGDKVRLFVPGKDRLFDVSAVEAEYGVRPERMVDLRSLDGDSSDNIPGVPGFGLKTGAKLLRLYGSVDGIYASNFAGVTAAQYKKLRDSEKQVRLNQQLMVLHRDLPLMVAEQNPDQNVATQRLADVDVKAEPILAALLGGG
jgi:5'-3' exonuclease/transcription antitermination factor NusG